MKEILVLMICGSLAFVGCKGKSTSGDIFRTESKSEAMSHSVVQNDLDTISVIKISENNNSSSVIQKKNRTLEEYKENILKFSESTGQILTFQIESIIPINEEEFLYFYSLSYPEEYPESNLELYYKLDKTMLEYAIKDIDNCLFLYSNLAEFVDGEYADFYFEAIKDVVKSNVDKFCSITYPSLSNYSKERLIDIYEEYCKSIN